MALEHCGPAKLAAGRLVPRGSERCFPERGGRLLEPFARGGRIDLVGAHGLVGEDRDHVVTHFSVAALHEQGLSRRAGMNCQQTGLERGQEGNVERQDPELAE